MHIHLFCMYGLFFFWDLLLGELNSLNEIIAGFKITFVI